MISFELIMDRVVESRQADTCPGMPRLQRTTHDLTRPARERRLIRFRPFYSRNRTGPPGIAQNRYSAIGFHKLQAPATARNHAFALEGNEPILPHPGRKRIHRALRSPPRSYGFAHVRGGQTVGGPRRTG